MPAFKRPRRVIFVDELPKTATGKMQRFKLREQLDALSGDPLDDSSPGQPAAFPPLPPPPAVASPPQG
jgi:hypothetical protein